MTLKILNVMIPNVDLSQVIDQDDTSSEVTLEYLMEGVPIVHSLHRGHHDQWKHYFQEFNDLPDCQRP